MPKFRIVAESSKTDIIAKEFEADSLDRAIEAAESEEWTSNNGWVEFDSTTNYEIRRELCEQIPDEIVTPADLMMYFLVVHTHKHGVSNYVVKSRKIPSVQDVVPVLNLDFDPYLGEEIEISMFHYTDILEVRTGTPAEGPYSPDKMQEIIGSPAKGHTLDEIVADAREEDEKILKRLEGEQGADPTTIVTSRR